MYRQIAYLTIKLHEQTEKTEHFKNLYENVKNEYEELQINVSNFLKSDQLTAMSGKKVQQWSSEALQKSITLKQIGGNQALEFCRKNLVPVLAPSTLRKMVQGVAFPPGILHFNIDLLKLLLDNFEDYQLIGDINTTRKVPARLYDQSTGCFIGNITWSQSNE